MLLPDTPGREGREEGGLCAPGGSLRRRQGQRYVFIGPQRRKAEKKKKQAKPLNHRQDASKTCAREQGSEPAYSKFDTEHAGGMLPASGDGACVWRMVWPQGGHLHKRHQPDLGAACWDRQLAPALLPVDGWTPPQTRHSWYF